MLRRVVSPLVSRRAFSTGKYVLPQLDFDYGELAPYISPELLQIHHSKHHATYVNNLNAAMEKLEDAVAKKNITQIAQLQQVVKFNGGGHLNHALFWKNLAPPNKGGGVLHDGELKTLLINQFGSFDNFVAALSAASVGVQGSGWGWLGWDKTNKTLVITTTGNQEVLEAATGVVPLLAVDVWEHAYYLDVSI